MWSILIDQNNCDLPFFKKERKDDLLCKTKSKKKIANIVALVPRNQNPKKQTN